MSSSKELAEFCVELADQPQSAIALLDAIAGSGVKFSLSGYKLYISARGGMRIDNRYTAAKPYIVAVPLPDDCTVGRLMAALIDCPWPAVILGKLRHSSGGDKYIGDDDRRMISDFVTRFQQVLDQPTNVETLSLILEELEEREARAANPVGGNQ